MARGTDIQYIRFSADGNAARKLAAEPAPFKEATFTKVFTSKRKCYYLDPVAIFGILVAVAMFITMAAGYLELRSEQAKLARMQEYVSSLQQKNDELEQTYLESYDPEEVERTALALGMIRKEQAPVVSIEVEVPQPVQTVSLWERIGTFLTGLFA